MRSREPRNYRHGTQWPHFRLCALEIDMLGALAALLIFQCLGEGVSYVFHLPVPGPVIGMLLLFGFIMMRPQTADAIEPDRARIAAASVAAVRACGRRHHGVGKPHSRRCRCGDRLDCRQHDTRDCGRPRCVTRALMRRQQRRQPHDRADTEAAQ